MSPIPSDDDDDKEASIATVVLLLSPFRSVSFSKLMVQCRVTPVLETPSRSARP